MPVKVKAAFWVQALKLARKSILYARGGYSKKEKKELAEDLLLLAADLLDEVADDLGGDDGES